MNYKKYLGLFEEINYNNYFLSKYDLVETSLNQRNSFFKRLATALTENQNTYKNIGLYDIPSFLDKKSLNVAVKLLD